MRTLVIGDIHGCHRSLVALEAAARITPTDLVITLGDHVDRGPDSRDVVEWLIHRHATGRLTALRGNHELMLLAARESASAHAEWLACGGDAVLASYGVRHVSQLPRDHLEFLETRLVAHALAATHFCVHANAYPDVPIEEQPDFMLYWEDFGRPRPHESGLTMICGHTPQHSGWPLDLGHAVCVDTGAGFGGWLTCLDPARGFCWQANERGQTRELWLGDEA